jgi:hypothetical protein
VAVLRKPCKSRGFRSSGRARGTLRATVGAESSRRTRCSEAFEIKPPAETCHHVADARLEARQREPHVWRPPRRYPGPGPQPDPTPAHSLHCVRDRDKPSSGPDDLDASDDVDVLKPDLTDGPRASDRVGGFRSFAAVIPELDAAAVVVANRARSVGRLGLRVMGRSHRASRKNTDRLGEVAGSTAAPGARSIGRTSATRRRSHLPCRHACSPRKRKHGQRRRVRLRFVPRCATNVEGGWM